MDEGLLNDLLECSVCLERLDTSSRVLPCQHTFCLKCLKVIVESHKELRCPECRVLVEAKVEELPPNVLLMRILEGMKNSAPRKLPTQRVRSGHSQLQPQNQHIQQTSRSDTKQLPPHARALFDYISKESGDLSFKKGETILLQKKLDQFWYQGDCSGRNGIFPINYVQVVVPLPTPNALCKALYDFRMSAPDEEGCLAFDKGAIISVHRRVDENWAEGRLEQRVGIFPIAFVELNQAARQLMNSTPLNRPVPPLPEHARPSHSDHRHHTQHARYQQMTMSTPSTQSNYQNIATMSQSHPNYQQAQILTNPPHSCTQTNQTITTISHGGLLSTAALPRNILEPTQTKHAMDLVHMNIHNKHSTMGIQSVSRIGDNYDRLRTHKYENYSSTPVHKIEHFPVSVANFNAGNVSSDSSSSMTPSVGVSSTTTPNSSSNTSTCESAEPSLPSSPDNAERNAAVAASNTAQNPETEPDASLNVSMGVLSLNESSTATNTSLNVTLPSEAPKSNASTSCQSQSQTDVSQNQDAASNTEVSRSDVPCSSKSRCRNSDGPESLLNFGIGLQAALSPAHKDGFASRHHHKEKRHSLTPSTHLQGNHATPNRHSAEILATSLLDHTPERSELQRTEQGSSRDSSRRRRRSRSSERPLPAAYVALYPYTPQRQDELELKRGAIYTVIERCRDGWYKGSSERSLRYGVFPGNYVTPAHGRHVTEKSSLSPAPAPAPAWRAPDAPPRAHTPLAQHKHDKQKEKSKVEKTSISSGVSLMKRLAAMKKCKSPPPAGYSMDNPVFEDGPGTSLMLNMGHHPVHVRSGSCPSQLLRALPGSERIRHKERPSVLPTHHHSHRSNEDPWQTQHRKSQSLDVTATRRDKQHSQAVKERFRCIVPYPPNSEYELELKVDDIVIVSKKRGDGWYKGTLQRTGRTGLFPASFVQNCPE